MSYLRRFSLAAYLPGALLVAVLAACNPAPTAPAPLAEYTGPDDEAAVLAFARQQAPRQAVLYFGADWCGPCRRFRAALADGQVADALRPAALLHLNADNYPGLATRYEVTAIPAFVKLDAQGRVQAHITSDRWDEDTPAHIAPVMRELVSGHGYDAPQ